MNQNSRRSAFHPVTRFKYAALAAVWLVAGTPSVMQAQVVSVDFTPNNGLAFGTTPTAMSPTGDLAGAPGSRAGYWNMVSSTSYSTTGTLLNNSGATVSGLSLNVAAGGSAIYTYNNNSASTNDYSMYNNLMDISSSATISLANVPYATYDLIVYLFPDASSTSPRGGSITVGSTTYYVNGGYNTGDNAVGIPDGNGDGYILSTATTLSDSEASPGNYVEFTGLTGSSLTADLDAVNFGDGVPRLKVSGFQIVATPEPATFAMLSMGLLGGMGMIRWKAGKK